MVRTKAIDPIARQYVENVLAASNGDLGFSARVRSALPPSGLQIIDLLEIVELGMPVALVKEDPHETLFEIEGHTTEGVRIRVTVSFNPLIASPVIMNFERF